MSDLDLYQLLKVGPSASQEEIREALTREYRHWRRRASNAPNSADRRGAEERVEQLSLAGRTLLDAGARASYDAARGHRAPDQGPSGPAHDEITRFSPPRVPDSREGSSGEDTKVRAGLTGKAKRNLGFGIVVASIVVAQVVSSKTSSKHSHAQGGTTTAAHVARATAPAFLDALTQSSGKAPDSKGVATVNGRSFSHTLTYTSDYSGIGTSWKLSRAYRRFSAVIAVGNCTISCPASSALFEVTIDGRTVISQEVDVDHIVPVSASIDGGREIKLGMKFFKPFPGDGTWYWGRPMVSP